MLTIENAGFNWITMGVKRMISNKLIYVSWKNLVFFLGIDLFFGVGKILVIWNWKIVGPLAKETMIPWAGHPEKVSSRKTVEIVEAMGNLNMQKHWYPLVNIQKTMENHNFSRENLWLTMENHHAIFMGSYPLFRLGHVQVRKLWMFIRGNSTGHSTNDDVHQRHKSSRIFFRLEYVCRYTVLIIIETKKQHVYCSSFHHWTSHIICWTYP